METNDTDMLISAMREIVDGFVAGDKALLELSTNLVKKVTEQQLSIEFLQHQIDALNNEVRNKK